MPRSVPMALEAHPRASGAEVTILVVDDERAVRSVVQRTLRQHGYTVIDAADGPSALSLLASADSRVRLMLTDDRMPGMSGRELVAIVARVYPAVRVVLMSGNPGAAAGSQATLVLPKPFSAHGLIETVHAALAEPSGGEAAQ